MSMGIRIKERRKEMHMTQDELGEKLGVQKSAVAKWENGRVENIKRSVIQKMADILECSPVYLMGFEEDMPKEELSEDEIQLLAYYRNVNQEGKDFILKQAETTQASGLYNICHQHELSQKEA